MAKKKTSKKDRQRPVQVRILKPFVTPRHLTGERRDIPVKELKRLRRIPRRRFAPGVISMTPADISRYALRKGKEYELVNEKKDKASKADEKKDAPQQRDSSSGANHLPPGGRTDRQLTGDQTTKR